jgi:hypothetical protein
MTSDKKDEGKAAVHLNALRHCLLSRKVLLLPREDDEALGELDEHLRAELQPVGELENLLVDRVVAAVWRLQRLVRHLRLGALGGAGFLMEIVDTTITDE